MLPHRHSALPLLSSVLYLEGSVLVFEDIFRLVAFYCVSRCVDQASVQAGLGG